MNKVIIGCDPDSNKSGFCFLIDGEMRDILSMSTVDFFLYLYNNNLPTITFKNVELHIENLNGISSNAFSVKCRDPLPVKLKKAEHVGKCKHAQLEIERVAEHFGISIVRHGVSKMWKDSKTGKAALKEIFDYTGQSNEDTRSAAYFAYLGFKQSKTQK